MVCWVARQTLAGLLPQGYLIDNQELKLQFSTCYWTLAVLLLTVSAETH